MAVYDSTLPFKEDSQKCKPSAIKFSSSAGFESPLHFGSKAGTPILEFGGFQVCISGCFGPTF
jgi:hypothetical protein